MHPNETTGRSYLVRRVAVAVGKRWLLVGRLSETVRDTFSGVWNQHDNQPLADPSGARQTFNLRAPVSAGNNTDVREAIAPRNSVAMFNNTDEDENSIDSETTSGAIAGSLERLEHGHVARKFDEAEDSQPDLYIPEGVPKASGQRYRAEGETDGEWIESGYVVAVGGIQ